ncbi:MAG: FAD-dependent oxidoreductase [Anaerolineae bacterium]|jgi:thioredoxin reductase (NADPH)|nr:FAD-dependent oxidoreductase [Anaerolineae bacterium]
MAKPVIMAVDDDASVLSAITRDLRRRYGENYRIIRADSGQAALEAVRELKHRNEAIALFLVDQRMPQLNGVQFLTEALPFYPNAKRALLTAYADTDAAIQAINTASIHHYLLKPWDPPEEKLYPVLDDLLDDWLAGYRPPFEGLRIVGHRWSPETHELKDFLARNHVPYQYLDVELKSETHELLQQLQLTAAKLPLLLYPDGEVGQAPSVAQVAEKIGLKTRAEQTFYDLAIVGGGPAGLAAAVYAASEGLRTVMIERQAPGGQAGTSSKIENYLGFPSGISGSELARRAVDQAKRFGVEILAPQEVIGLEVKDPYRILKLKDGSEVTCYALVVSVGLTYRKLNADGIDRLNGAGVYYGASNTEAVSCKDQPVFIIGAGNSAGQAAMYLAEFASEVILLVRGNSLEAKMSQYLVDRIHNTPNIQVWLETEIAAVGGNDHLETVTVSHLDSGEQTTHPASGLFIFIGAQPCTDWLNYAVEMDSKGFLLTGAQLIRGGKLPKGWTLERAPYLLETSVPGIFAVGDVRAESVKRVASAVGEGSIAVQLIHQYLTEVR